MKPNIKMIDGVYCCRQPRIVAITGWGLSLHAAYWDWFKNRVNERLNNIRAGNIGARLVYET